MQETSAAKEILKSMNAANKFKGSNDEKLVYFVCDMLEINKDPESGPVMEGTGGIRKVRFPLRNRGKSGSVRVCYTDFAEYEVTYLLTAFTKKDQENLTAEEKSVLKKLVKALKEEASKNRRGTSHE